jgi:proline iminopeptidase
MLPVPGAELFYTKRGRGRPCLVLTAVGTAPYERQMPERLGDHLEIVFVDLRGSGRSSGNPPDLTFDRIAQDLDAVREHLGAERVAVLGHSILGVLAIEYAKRCPANVSHVVTVGTPPRGDMKWLLAQSQAFFEEDASEERKALLRANLARLGQGSSPRDAVFAQTPMRFYDPRFDAAALFAGASENTATLWHVMSTLTPAWDVRAEAASLRTPILLAHGRYDYAVPHKLWNGVAEAIPSATRRLFERSGHQPFVEEPERFVATVTDWMGS